MKCEKCGYDNSVYDIICEKCDTPLNIENNTELKKKYNKKPKAIDIEYIGPDREAIDFNSTRQMVRYSLAFILGAVFISIIIFGVFLIKSSKCNDVLTRYNNFIKDDGLRVIYFGKDDNANKLFREYEKKYEISYMHINTNKITAVKRNKIKNDLDLDVINSTVVIMENGRMIDHIDKANHNLDVVNKFLIKNNVIPIEDGDTDVVKNNFSIALNSQSSIIMYIANNKNESNLKHNEVIKNFCNNYSLNYVFIEGYYLSDNQKLAMLNKLNYTEIHNELFVVIDEGEVKEVDEDINDDPNTYFSIASNYGIISNTNINSIKEITTKQFISLMSSKEKCVFLLNTDDCVYCERLKPIIGKIGIQNNFNIYSIKIDSKSQKSFENYIHNRGFNEEKISTPLVLISENDKILDYIVGYSDKDLYLDRFRANGVIR